MHANWGTTQVLNHMNNVKDNVTAVPKAIHARSGTEEGVHSLSHTNPLQPKTKQQHSTFPPTSKARTIKWFCLVVEQEGSDKCVGWVP